MGNIDILLDAPWIIGFVASLTRVSAFVVASPILGKRVPAAGRLSFVVGVSLFLVQPVEGDTQVIDLVTIVMTNTAVGIVLGFFTGLLFYAFTIGGSQLDMSSGLAMAQQLDPLTGNRVSIFARLFDSVAITLFFIIGGHRLLMAGIYRSTQIIPLDGSISLDGGLAAVLVERIGWTILVGLQIAMPALAALFLAELVLGIGSRLLPQANIFMIGLPAKQLVALALALAVIVAFPQAVALVVGGFEDTFLDVLDGLRVS